MSLQSLHSVYEDQSPTGKMVSIAVELYGGRQIITQGRVADMGETQGQVNLILANPPAAMMAFFPFDMVFGRNAKNIAFLTATGKRWRVLSTDIKGNIKAGLLVAAKLVHEGTTEQVPVVTP